MRTDQQFMPVTVPKRFSQVKAGSLFDIGEWLARRFPRGYKFVVWIVLPLAYVTVSSLADNGNL